jgi:hypothetical protein
MYFRSLSLLVGLLVALLASLGSHASADTYFSDRWLPETSIGGVPVTGGFVYDATTGTVVGDTSGLAGFCASGACGLHLSAGNALTLSDGNGGFLNITFHTSSTFQTFGSNRISLVENWGGANILGVEPGIAISAPGGLRVSPVNLLLEQWSANASFGGVPIMGSFLYDATDRVILSSNTSIAGFCSSATCGLRISASNVLTISNGDVGSLDIIFRDPTFQTLGSNPISRVFDSGGTIIAGVEPGISVSATGALNVSAAPAPSPGAGLTSLLALAGGIFTSRSRRERGA